MVTLVVANKMNAQEMGKFTQEVHERDETLPVRFGGKVEEKNTSDEAETVGRVRV